MPLPYAGSENQMSCTRHFARNNLRPVESRFCAATVGLVLALGSFLPRGHALDWQTGNGWRSAPLPVAKSGSTRFTSLPPAATGIAFTNQLSDTNAALNQIRLNGSGVAAGDVGGDGPVGPYFFGVDKHQLPFRQLGPWEIEGNTGSP